MTGIGSLVAEIILKGFGAFGSYNPVTIVMTFTMFCMMIAVVRYGYFGSLHAAVDNAFNHGDEGLIILDMDGAIILSIRGWISFTREYRWAIPWLPIRTLQAF